MDYNSMSQGMMGGNMGVASFFMWLTYALIVVLIVLGIIALLKYINKN
ncbi:MAG: hypothetical protein HW405_74 [Candidatus Berkelbacteria bacterium]|nr:hypothetical protein [Candidatus Berkelbacteria bacterium]